MDATLNRQITQLRGQGSPEALAEATRLEAEAEDRELETAEGSRAAQLEQSKAVREAVADAGLEGHDGLRVGSGPNGALTLADVDRVKSAEGSKDEPDSPFTSEAAEKAAKDAGLDPDKIEASGANGKITVKDVKKAKEAS